MRILFLSLFGICTVSTSLAQEQSSTIGQEIDEITFNWDIEAKNLNDYDGLTQFCKDVDYRTNIISLLNQIHHYDSVLYDRLVKAQRFNHDKEIEKTLKEISKFEDKYSMKSFIHFLHEECVAQKDIEKNSIDSKNDFGTNSYEGQIYIVETELNKFIKHITKRVDHVREHVHHLHIK